MRIQKKSELCGTSKLNRYAFVRGEVYRFDGTHSNFGKSETERLRLCIKDANEDIILVQLSTGKYVRSDLSPTTSEAYTHVPNVSVVLGDE